MSPLFDDILAAKRLLEAAPYRGNGFTVVVPEGRCVLDVLRDYVEQKGTQHEERR